MTRWLFLLCLIWNLNLRIRARAIWSDNCWLFFSFWQTFVHLAEVPSFINFLLLDVQQKCWRASLFCNLLNLINNIFTIRAFQTFVDIMGWIYFKAIVSILLILENYWHSEIFLFSSRFVKRSVLIKSVGFIGYVTLYIFILCSIYGQLCRLLYLFEVFSS